jgi:hypothetical protein
MLAVQALYASKIVSYAQGFMLLREAAKVHGWNLNYGGIALMWRGGCIIRRWDTLQWHLMNFLCKWCLCDRHFCQTVIMFMGILYCEDMYWILRKKDLLLRQNISVSGLCIAKCIQEPLWFIHFALHFYHETHKHGMYRWCIENIPSKLV